MFRTLTLAVAVALSMTFAGMAQAGGFNFIKVNKQSTCQSGKFNKVNQHNLYGGQIISTYPAQQTYIAPVQKHTHCYFKVLYTKPCWSYIKTVKVDTLAEAQLLAHQLDNHGYQTAIKKVALAHRVGLLGY